MMLSFNAILFEDAGKGPVFGPSTGKRLWHMLEKRDQIVMVITTPRSP